MQKIIPCLWFNGIADKAVEYYLSIFKDGKILNRTTYPAGMEEVSGRKTGETLTIDFSILGQTFTALNAGPEFTFTEAVSFQVFCKDQEEIDYYWEKLSQGGDKNAQVCGWLKDKFGVSWQIVPIEWNELIKKGDSKKIEKLMHELLTMKKIDIKKLKDAYNNTQ